jgi:hypothetical protein
MHDVEPRTSSGLFQAYRSPRRPIRRETDIRGFGTSIFLAGHKNRKFQDSLGAANVGGSVPVGMEAASAPPDWKPCSNCNSPGTDAGVVRTGA